VLGPGTYYVRVGRMPSLRTEPAGPISKQYRDVVRNLVGYGEVRNTVAIEITDCEVIWSVARGDSGLWAEAPGSIAHEDGDVVGDEVGRREVQLTVRVEVTGDYGARSLPHREDGLWTEAGTGTGSGGRRVRGHAAGYRDRRQ
jgi:hypothetical protein